MARYILLDGGDLDDGQPILDSDLIIEKDAAKFEKTLALLQRRGSRIVEGEIAADALAALVAQAQRKPAGKIVLPTGHTFYGGGFVEAHQSKMWER